MKKLKIMALTCFCALFISVAFAEDVKQPQPLTSDSQACKSLKESGASDETLAKRGCCSHHKGVCGCSGGRASCCDGTLSPSCGCKADSPIAKPI